jgi:hypothetical protein
VVPVSSTLGSEAMDKGTTKESLSLFPLARVTLMAVSLNPNEALVVVRSLQLMY